MLKEKLKEIRKYTGLSQPKFAKKVGCSAQHISNQEKGRSAVTFKTLEHYCECLDLEIELIISKDGDVIE